MKKKRALPKIDEVTRRKRKLLNESSLVVKKVKVHFQVRFVLLI